MHAAQVIDQMDVGPGGRSSQLSPSVRQNGADLVLQLACWTATTGQGVRADIAGKLPGSQLVLFARFSLSAIFLMCLTALPRFLAD